MGELNGILSYRSCSRICEVEVRNSIVQLRTTSAVDVNPVFRGDFRRGLDQSKTFRVVQCLNCRPEAVRYSEQHVYVHLRSRAYTHPQPNVAASSWLRVPSGTTHESSAGTLMYSAYAPPSTYVPPWVNPATWSPSLSEVTFLPA